MLNSACRLLSPERSALLPAAIVLAVGVGSAVGMLRFVDALAFRPPAGIRAPEELVEIRVRNYAKFKELEGQTESLVVSAVTRSQVAMLLNGETLEATVECVEGPYFNVLGVQTPLARAPAKGTVILSSELARARFGSGTAIGKTLQLGVAEYVVADLAPAGFTGVQARRVDAWVLIESSPEMCSQVGVDLRDSTSAGWLWTVGRLRRGAAITQAEREVAEVLGPLETMDARAPEISARYLSPLFAKGVLNVPGWSNSLAWLAAGAALVWLLACLNVGGLLATFALSQQHDVALRQCLGASTLRAAGPTAAAIGGAAVISAVPAAVAAFWTGLILENAVPDLQAPPDGWRSLAIFAGTFSLAWLLSCALPAWLSYRSRVVETISGGGTVLRAGKLRWRKAVIAGQTCAAMVLLVCSAQFFRSVRAAHESAGFDISGVIATTLDFQRSGYEEGAVTLALWHQLLDRTERLPGVSSTSLSSGAILNSFERSTQLAVSVTGVRKPIGAVVHAVTDRYFATVGSEILDGRGFRADGPSGEPVAVVSRPLATKLGIRDLHGLTCISVARVACVVVIGIAEGRRSIGLTSLDEVDELFVPLSQADRYPGRLVPKTMFVRASADYDGVIESVAVLAKSIAPPGVLTRSRSLVSLAGAQTARADLAGLLLQIFGIASVLLAGAGVFSALSLAVRQRTTELGLKMALGAESGDIVRDVGGQGLVPVIAGVGLGALIAWNVGAVVASRLYGIAGSDSGAIVAGAAVVLGSAVAACIPPIVRAVRLDPKRCLQHL